MKATAPIEYPLVAVDVGNSRVKLGWFENSPQPGEFPTPDKSLTVDAEFMAESLAEWLEAPAAQWVVASVAAPTAERLRDLVLRAGKSRFHLLESHQLPIVIDVPQPNRVGIDRLVDAIAANALRSPQRGAIVIDLGSAITVDSVSADGRFLGGAILPGIGMSARALHEFTNLLPLSEMKELRDAPEPLGKDTTAALRSGLFWGAVGAMKELTERLSASVPTPQIFITGGAAPSVAAYVTTNGEHARFIPHLTLSGIAIASRSLA